MLRLVVFLVAAAALAWAAVWVVNHPGTLVVQWLGHELILSVGTVIVAVLLFAALVILLFELLRWLVGLPSRWRVGRSRRRQVRGYEEVTRGLMAAAAGDLSAARAHHRLADRYLPDNGALLLLSAQTAQLEGKEEVAHLKFRQMLDRRDAEFVGLRGLLAQTMRTGDFDEALTLARRAYRRSPTTPWVLTTLFELLARAERWDEALTLVNEMRSQKLLDDAEAKRRQGILRHLLATRLRQQERGPEALAEARRAVKAAPGFAPAAVQAAELAMQQGRRRLALQVLEESWRIEPHPEVGRAYAQLDPNETPAQRLQRVNTRLAPLNRSNPETAVLQAELAMQAQEWETARERLESALATTHTARVYRLLAELERQAHGNTARAQEWLAQAIDAEPDRAWIADDSGEVLPAWQPFSPGGRFDAVRWSTPPKIATLIGAEQTSYIMPRDETAPPTPPPPETASTPPRPSPVEVAAAS
jgi:HemY protein